MNPVIMCVDDEQIILTTLKLVIESSFHKKFTVVTASSGKDALAMIDELNSKNYEIPIVISDYIMPGMYGDEFLKLARLKLPDSKFILLTGQASLSGVENSMNWANLYRYISKPWEKNDLILTLSEAVKSFYISRILKHQNNTISKSYEDFNKGFEQKLNGLYNENINLKNDFEKSVISLLEIILNSNIVIKNKSIRMRKYASIIIEQASLTNKYEIYLGIVISQLSCINLDKNLFHTYYFNLNITNIDSLEIQKKQTKVLESFLKIPFYSKIKYAIEYYNNSLVSKGNKLDNYNLETINIADIIKITFDYDKYIKLGITSEEALKKMFEARKKYNLTFLQHLRNYIGNNLQKNDTQLDTLKLTAPTKESTFLVSFDALTEGLILADAIFDVNNVKLVTKGVLLTEELLNSLHRYESICKINEPIKIYNYLVH
jgi:YesN/AraC family two-component response regulator